jgi:predicted ATPase
MSQEARQHVGLAEVRAARLGHPEVAAAAYEQARLRFELAEASRDGWHNSRTTRTGKTTCSGDRLNEHRCVGNNAEDLMAGRRPFISRVRLRNYKSIAECDVSLGPLTILIGPNASGKSNFLDALSFLARALSTTPNQAVEERGGIDAILRNSPDQTDSFEIEVEINFPWDEDLPATDHAERWARAIYGFRISRNTTEDKRPFAVQSEDCSLETPDRNFRFNVRQGCAQDITSAGSPIEIIEPDSLYLQIAGTRKTYAPLGRRLRRMRFYNFVNDVLREPEPVSGLVALGTRGERLASVLGGMEALNPLHKHRLDEYLRAIVPGTIALEQWLAGPFITVKLRMAGADNTETVEFGPTGMSDGTIRAAGVLAALFQPEVTQGRTPLVGIEEPEIALHPAAAGVLFDALNEASHQVQVIATSQSPDLLDRDDLDVGIVRAVSMTHGLTTIGEIDEPSRRIVKDKLYTLGELMRGNQISPEGRTDYPEE